MAKRTFKVWFLVGTDGYVYVPTAEYTRKDCLKTPHERGVKAVRATIVIPLSPPKKRARSKPHDR